MWWGGGGGGGGGGGVINDANSIPVSLKPNGRIEHLLTNASSERVDVKFIKPCNYLKTSIFN